MKFIHRLLLKLFSNHIVFLIKKYYSVRDYTWPNQGEALDWAITEIGEAKELLLARKNWVRNNPQNKESYTNDRFVSECGDIVLMAIVASIVTNRSESGNALFAMLKKMNKHLKMM